MSTSPRKTMTTIPTGSLRPTPLEDLMMTPKDRRFYEIVEDKEKILHDIRHAKAEPLTPQAVELLVAYRVMQNQTYWPRLNFSANGGGGGRRAMSPPRSGAQTERAPRTASSSLSRAHSDPATDSNGYTLTRLPDRPNTAPGAGPVSQREAWPDKTGGRSLPSPKGTSTSKTAAAAAAANGARPGTRTSSSRDRRLSAPAANGVVVGDDSRRPLTDVYVQTSESYTELSDLQERLRQRMHLQEETEARHAEELETERARIAAELDAGRQAVAEERAAMLVQLEADRATAVAEAQQKLEEERATYRAEMDVARLADQARAEEDNKAFKAECEAARDSALAQVAADRAAMESEVAARTNALTADNAALRETADSLTKEVARLTAEAAAAKQALEAAQKQAAEQADSNGKQAAELDELRKQLAQTTERLAAKEREVQAASDDKQRQQQQAEQSSVDKLNAALAQAEKLRAELAKRTDEASRLRADLDKASSSSSSANEQAAGALKAALVQVESLQAQKTSLEAANAALDRDLRAALALIEQLKAQLEQKDREFRDLALVAEAAASAAAANSNNAPRVSVATTPAAQAIGACVVCSEKIVDNKVQALGKEYHAHCFKCSNCGTQLGNGVNFYDAGGDPDCETCYKEVYCPKCSTCNQPVVGHCITAMGKKWHVDHFICAHCQKPLGDEKFFEKAGLPYCSADFFKLFAPKCKACGESVSGECLNALGAQWHPHHFTCAQCGPNSPSLGENFFEHNGVALCKDHFAAISK